MRANDNEQIYSMAAYLSLVLMPAKINPQVICHNMKVFERLEGSTGRVRRLLLLALIKSKYVMKIMAK